MDSSAPDIHGAAVDPVLPIDVFPSRLDDTVRTGIDAGGIRLQMNLAELVILQFGVCRDIAVKAGLVGDPLIIRIPPLENIAEDAIILNGGSIAVTELSQAPGIECDQVVLDFWRVIPEGGAEPDARPVVGHDRIIGDQRHADIGFFT